MRKFSFFLLFAAIVASFSSAFATESTDKVLFRVARNSEIPLPVEKRVGSTFIAMDMSKFEALANWRQFVCVFENIPIPELGPHTLRVEQFDDVAPDIKGKPVPKHAFFRGSVDGSPESHVCITLFYDRAWGYINIGDHSYVLSAAGRAETGELILGISEDTVVAPPLDCGVKEWNMSTKLHSLAALAQEQEDAGNTPLALGKDSMYQLRVAIELDSPVVKLLGGTDTSAFKYALSVLAAASDLYIRDAKVALICSEHFEWVGNDPYPDVTACELLNTFDGSNFTGPSPSLFVLMSARHTDWCGGVAADIDALCAQPNNKCVLGIKSGFPKNGWMYPYNNWTWDAMVCAHETGHVVACAHTHNCYFYSGGPIDSCYQAEGGCFDSTKATRGTIMSYCHLTSAGAMLKFHPKCSAKIVAALARKSTTCKDTVLIPHTTVTPTRLIQTCQASASFSLTASGGRAPYGFEINPVPLSMTTNGATCNFTLAPAKSGATTFYIRVTTADTNRSYDSVVFLPAALTANVVQDTMRSTKDSIMLVAAVSDTIGGKCQWNTVPVFRSIGSGWQVLVPRPINGEVVKYYAKVTVGTCVVQDTITINGEIQPPASVEETSAGQLRLFPNPAHDRITLVLPSAAEHVWIADALGRQMTAPQSHSAISVGDRAGEQIDFVISQLPAGSYWIVREVNGRTQSAAFQKN